MKTAIDFGEIMPNIPEMSRFFSTVGAAIQISTTDRASAQAALQVRGEHASPIGVAAPVRSAGAR